MDFSSKRVRIVQKNMTTYSGPIGAHNFTDGKSDTALSYHEYMSLGACMAIVPLDQKSEKKILTPASVMVDRTATSESEFVKKFNDGTVFLEADKEDREYSREELEEIAQKSGLPGVREIARKFNCTGRSISDCINAIIEAQKGKPSEDDGFSSEDPDNLEGVDIVRVNEGE